MLTFLFTSMLLATPQAGAPPAAHAKVEVPADLKKAATAVTDSKGYAFEVTSESTGGFSRGGRGGPGGGPGGGAGAPPAGGAPAGGPPAGGAAGGPGAGSGRGGFDGPQTFTGKFEKGKPVAMTRDDQTVYRLDQQIAYSKDGAWEVFTPGSFGQGGPGGARGGRGGAPGGAPTGAPGAPAGGPPAGGAPAGGAPPAGGVAAGGPPGGGDMCRMMSLMTFANFTMPHEVLASIDTAMTEVKREEKDGKVVFSGPLAADLAEKLSGAGRMKEMMARFGGGAGGPELTSSGTLSITVTKDGAIESMHLETKISGGPGGDVSRKVDVKLSGVGATTVDVPKEVLAKFST